jgi:hypothetical protein
MIASYVWLISLKSPHDSTGISPFAECGYEYVIHAYLISCLSIVCTRLNPDESVKEKTNREDVQEFV